jgi:hypothetical protein
VTRPWYRFGELMLVAAVLALLPAGGFIRDAWAARAPTTRERAAIVHAIHASPKTSLVPDAWYRVIAVRVSTVRSTWARAAIVPRLGYEGRVQSAGASLHKLNHRWHVFSVAHGGGCDVPETIRRDLQLGCY